MSSPDTTVQNMLTVYFFAPEISSTKWFFTGTLGKISSDLSKTTMTITIYYFLCACVFTVYAVVGQSVVCQAFLAILEHSNSNRNTQLHILGWNAFFSCAFFTFHRMERVKKKDSWKRRRGEGEEHHQNWFSSHPHCCTIEQQQQQHQQQEQQKMST